MKLPELFERPIALEYVEGIAVLIPRPNCCPLRAAVFICRNHRRWVKHNALWDMREFDFSRLDYSDISKFVGQVQKTAQKRNNLKTAVLISSTIGLGVFRMFETLLDGRDTGLSVQSFDDRNEAMAWLQG